MIFHNITPGIEGKQQLSVALKDTAKAYGSGLVEVFATPAMIALMEYTAHLSLAEFLAQGYVSVGSEISVKHIKATAVGKTVTAHSKVLAIEGKKVSFQIEAFDEDGKIGFGTHIRYIVEEKKFLEAL